MPLPNIVIPAKAGIHPPYPNTQIWEDKELGPSLRWNDEMYLAKSALPYLIGHSQKAWDEVALVCTDSEKLEKESRWVSPNPHDSKARTMKVAR